MVELSTFAVVVVLAALVVSAGTLWFFFAPRRSHRAAVEDGVQVVTVRVQGGYSPDHIQVVRGMPVRLVFDRQEAGDCSSRVVLPDFRINQALPAYSTTTVQFVPQSAGTFGFACGMNMLHGQVEVVDALEAAQLDLSAGSPGGMESRPGDADALRSAGQVEEDQARERRAEIADLTRRVVVGGVLTAPVLFAVMAHDVFGVDGVPGILLNPWVQLALITPVMFYTGWPIHRTGWLALSHRTADMNSLITLGTAAAFGYSLVATFAPGLLPAEVQEVYFEAVGVIITLILLGRLIETRAKAGTGEAIRTLIGLQPRTARVVRDGSRASARRAGRRR